MKLLSYADIMEGGTSVFTCSAHTVKDKLILSFQGEIRVEHPYKHLSLFVDEFSKKIKDEEISETEINFTELKYCNSNGFYTLMDIVEVVYQNVEGKVSVRRITGDDWQIETLPILLDLDNEDVMKRTEFIDEEPL